MPEVILDAFTFVRKLKVGDRFWFMADFYGEPLVIEGPFQIKKMRKGVLSHCPRVWYIREFPNGNTLKDSSRVDVFANPWNGVFKSHQDAHTYLTRQKYRFENNQIFRKPMKRYRDGILILLKSSAFRLRSFLVADQNKETEG